MTRALSARAKEQTHASGQHQPRNSGAHDLGATRSSYLDRPFERLERGILSSCSVLIPRLDDVLQLLVHTHQLEVTRRLNKIVRFEGETPLLPQELCSLLAARLDFLEDIHL